MKTLLAFLLYLAFTFSQLSSYCQGHFVVKGKYASKSDFVRMNVESGPSRVVVNQSSVDVIDDSQKVIQSVNRSNLPKNLKSFIFSPDKKYFVAYEEFDNGINDLYFYSANGTLLAKRALRIYPNIRFSSNGEYVTAFNNFGRQIFVFSKTGALLFEGDYTNLIGDKSKTLYMVLVSDNLKDVYVSAGNELYSINPKTKKVQFQTTTGTVWDGQFYAQQNALLIKTTGGNDSSFEIKLISKDQGKVIQTMKGIKKVSMTNKGFAIEEDSIIEYEIK